MKVGIDLDNTIINYTGVFYHAALEKGFIPVETGESKVAVKEYLCSQGQEDLWTKLQGYVYGARLELASVYKGFFSCLKMFKDNKIDYCIISHKTKKPFKGPRYDLHAQASQWIKSQLVPHIGDIEYTFCETIEEKLATIESKACDYFIDDLVMVLNHTGFPTQVSPLLFNGLIDYDGERFTEWREIEEFFKRKQ
ncbi:hypothetical protein PQO01_12260 [Lentisphaera marina]|uniref:hypothetical protein n=1 Tax=Lentisphaera marina TaxID=1111041 RepID=UPI0023667263|nr:hypothetical protein [Lentisphaera marina]MDD7985725.1 hypothetical protein [Lentisphaera marina]